MSDFELDRVIEKLVNRKPSSYITYTLGGRVMGRTHEHVIRDGVTYARITEEGSGCELWRVRAYGQTADAPAERFSTMEDFIASVRIRHYVRD